MTAVNRENRAVGSSAPLILSDAWKSPAQGVKDIYFPDGTMLYVDYCAQSCSGGVSVTTNIRLIYKDGTVGDILGTVSSVGNTSNNKATKTLYFDDYSDEMAKVVGFRITWSKAHAKSSDWSSYSLYYHIAEWKSE